MIVAHSDVLIDFLRGHGEVARRVALELESRGQSIGMADYMIAAVCIANQICPTAPLNWPAGSSS